MTNAMTTDTPDRSLTRDTLYAAKYYLGSRRALFFLLAAALIVGGAALNWGWLVAAGLAPILLSLLPCAAMCALGLCMHKMAGGAHGGSPSGTAGSARARGDRHGEFAWPGCRHVRSVRSGQSAHAAGGDGNCERAPRSRLLLRGSRQPRCVRNRAGEVSQPVAADRPRGRFNRRA